MWKLAASRGSRKERFEQPSSASFADCGKSWQVFSTERVFLHNESISPAVIPSESSTVALDRGLGPRRLGLAAMPA
jgi:hypothetical protein